MRKTIIAGNWKMNCLRADAAALITDLRAKLDGNSDGVEVLVCPPFTALATAEEH